jgi:hypothetical protein
MHLTLRLRLHRHHATCSARRSDFDTNISCYTVSTTVVFGASGDGCAAFHRTKCGHERDAIHRSECCTFGSAAYRDIHPNINRAISTATLAVYDAQRVAAWRGQW